ncbi:hypothetical protein TBS_26020 [Thermobispora bispora]|uniref:DUF4190 domain-containing protein n=1 Tax=Thermobispora bispora (strain ATCC 19993 / DSM 43833 / CBS 139.67 / JCM 10125 / KCTC 9307 / NBRC 14880 / R51) TaxID=469371 RepID=D6Y5N7_THEBD|nr:hypothetical protein [Thermobispora bispora]ADG87383.1 hypothetical protein Tbis_0658 [Thermobispora bispora DSM 43833]MBX6168538.1 hypothetical protein [Thermobispora bispora]MDI9579825.1 hypothetical protein [Thermobispora sp.]QSI47327.1 hypothetical protein CYL17_05235 [Thermobispora bispora]
MTTPLPMTPEMGGRRALAFALIALIFTLLLPTAGLVLSLFSIMIAIRDLRTLQLAKQRLGMAIGAVVIASIALLLGAASAAVQYYFSAELSAYYECTKGAGTVEAQQDCNDQLRRSVEKKLGVPLPPSFPSLL